MSVALVTGASSGIGLQFANQLAARGHDLVLVARDAARLGEVRDELGAVHGIRVEVMSADLGDRAALARVAARAASADEPVEILVNNAGFGLEGAFLDNPLEDEEASLDVMCRAVLVLCHEAGRVMRDRGSGQIVNVSSVAGWLATGSYSAAKSWVTVFSEGLAGQLAGSGVTVTALCPGFTRTEFHSRAQIDTGTFPSWMWLDAHRLVADCLADADAGKVVSTPGVIYQGVRLLTRLAPRRILRASGVARRHRPQSR